MAWTTHRLERIATFLERLKRISPLLIVACPRKIKKNYPLPLSVGNFQSFSGKYFLPESNSACTKVESRIQKIGSLSTTPKTLASNSCETTVSILVGSTSKSRGVRISLVRQKAYSVIFYKFVQPARTY